MLNDFLLDSSRKIFTRSNKKVFCVKLSLLFSLVCLVFLSYSLYTYVPYSVAENPALNVNFETTFTTKNDEFLFMIYETSFPSKYELIYDESCMFLKSEISLGYKLYSPLNYTRPECQLTFKLEYSLPENIEKDYTFVAYRGMLQRCLGDYTFYSSGTLDSDGKILTQENHQGCKIISGLNNQFFYISGSYTKFTAQQYNLLHVFIFTLNLTSLMWQISYNVINFINDRRHKTRTVKHISMDLDGNLALRV